MSAVDREPFVLPPEQRRPDGLEVMEATGACISVYIAGDAYAAKQALREYCMTGLCVTVTPTSFVYTGGAEEGVVVGLIDYPRFPTTFVMMRYHALAIGKLLMYRLCQQSFTIVTPSGSTFYSRRRDLPTVPKDKASS